MSRKRNRSKTKNPPISAQQVRDNAPRGIVTDEKALAILQRMVMRDSFSNPIARMGFGTPNISEGTEYPLTRLTNDYALLNSLYRNNWIVRNVIDTIPEDMTRNWIRIRSSLKPAEIGKIERLWRTRRLKQHILHGLKWGRLYGGAVGLIMIEGQEDQLDKAIDFDTIMPGSFKNLMIIDRWTGAYPSDESVQDLNDVEFGLPNYYELTLGDGSLQRVHHSRVIRFVGRQLPYWEQLAEASWGASEVEVVYEELKKRDNMSWNILNLSFMANLRFMKIHGLDALNALGDQQMQQDFYNVKESQNWLMSNGGLQLIGELDEFQQFQYTFAGINDIYQSFMMDLAGACKIPVTKLFGRSSAGMNATGESDMQNYYDTVQQSQESTLSPILDKLLPIMCMSELGYVPDDLDYDYNPIQEPNDQDLADLVDKKGTLLNTLFQSGLLSQKTVLKELQQMSESTGMFTNITDEDIEQADDSTSQGEVIPPDAFSGIKPTMATETPNRTGIQESNPTGDEKAWGLPDWIRRSKRNH